MKIAHVVATFPPYSGGMGNSAAQFAGTLAKHHDVTVLTPYYEKVEGYVSLPYRVERLASPLKCGNAALLPQLLWKLRRYDLVHFHYPFYGCHLVVLFACLVWRKKLVLHYHMDSLASGPKGWLFALNRLLCLPLILRRADVVIGSSLDYLAHSQVAGFYRSRPEKFREIPFWVDTDKFNPGEQPNGDEVVVLFVGGLDRAHYFKGLATLLGAMKEVVKRHTGVITLRVVGSGDLFPHYRQLANELDIADRVLFLGKLDNTALVRAYQQASFLVLPSINQGEAFGLVLLEAMASGKPVIASNLPGVRSVFADGEEGLIVRVADADDLADKILTLAGDLALRKRMGRNARALTLQKYREATIARYLEGLYEELLSRR